MAIIGPQSSSFTPESHKRRETLLDALLANASKPRPVYGIADALAGVAAPLVTAYSKRKNDEKADEARAASAQRYGGLVEALMGQAPAPSTFTATDPGSKSDLDKALLSAESGGNYQARNDLGYLGAYQFGEDRLRELGMYDDPTPRNRSGGAEFDWSGTFSVPGFGEMGVDQFLANPGAQDAAYGAHMDDLARQFEAMGLGQYTGQNIGGVTVSPESFAAMAHLGGAQGARQFIESGGTYNPADANGTRLSDYGGLPGVDVSTHPVDTLASMPPVSAGVPPAVSSPTVGGDPLQMAMMALTDPWAPPAIQELAGALLAQRMNQQPVNYGFTNIDGTLIRTNPRTGEAEVAGQFGADSGGFEGTNLDAQAMNWLRDLDPSDPRYAQAYAHLAAPKTQFDPTSGTLVTITPDMNSLAPKGPPPGMTTQQSPEAVTAGGQSVTATPVTGGRPTEQQRVTAGFAHRLESANTILNQFEQEGASLPQNIMRDYLPGGNYLVSPEFQQFEQAKRDFVNAILRKESGAVISDAEFENAANQYFPRPGDSPEVIRQKREAREIAVRNMIESAGPGYQGRSPLRVDGPAQGASLPPGFVVME